MNKKTTSYYIFGYKFVITSEPTSDDNWAVSVSLGNLKEDYIDRIDNWDQNRASAEQACFGYFLAEHCQGGIFWQEPTEEDKENLLAEKI